MWGIAPSHLRPLSLIPLPKPKRYIQILGPSVLHTSPKAASRPRPNRSKPHRSLNDGDSAQQEEVKEGPLINGSDVVWALQKASALRKKKHKKSSVRKQKEKETQVDQYSERDVRPLCIKSEWREKLDELEKRLRELSETNFS